MLGEKEPVMVMLSQVNVWLKLKLRITSETLRDVVIDRSVVDQEGFEPEIITEVVLLKLSSEALVLADRDGVKDRECVGLGELVPESCVGERLGDAYVQLPLGDCVGVPDLEVLPVALAMPREADSDSPLAVTAGLSLCDLLCVSLLRECVIVRTFFGTVCDKVLVSERVFDSC